MPGSLEKQIKDMMKFLIFIILFLPSLCLAQRYPPVGGVPAYADQAALPSFSTNGALAITVDTYTLWAFDINSLSWLPIAGASSISSIGTIDSQVASVNGGVATGGALYFQSASGVDPGLVNTSSQTFAGAKTFNSAPNFFSLTASTALELDGSKNLASSSTTSTELGYVHGVTSAIQTQLNALQPALTFTAPLVDTTNTVTCNVASGSQPGCLASADWTTFNNKQAALTFSAPLVNTANTVTCDAASGSQAGCLASADWTTFNNKSPAGNYATSGSGDVSWSAPSGPGAVTTSLVATTNSSLTTLSGLTTAGSLSTVGTIGTGVWQGTKIAIANGGTNASSAIAGSIPQASSTTASSWTATPTLGVAATTAGTLALASATASTGLVTLANQGTTSGNAYTFSFPLTGGASGYALTTNGSGTTTWSAVVTNPMTTLGDVILGGASGLPERLAVGTDGFALTANSNATYGVDYEDDSTPDQLRNAGLSGTVSSSILTVALKQSDGSTDPTSTAPVRAVMRSSTAASGASIKRNITAALSQTFSVGTSAGLGAQAQDLWLYLIDSDGAGTMKIGASAVLYNETDLQTTVAESGNATATNASPSVFTQTGHGYSVNDCVQLTGTPPTGFSTSTPYYVISTGLTANAFELSATPGGAAKNSSSTGSSIVVHYCGYKIASAAVYTSVPIRVLGKLNETFSTIGTWVNPNSIALIQKVPARQDISARYTNSSTSISGSVTQITWANVNNDPLNMSPGKATVIIPIAGHYQITAQTLQSFTGILGSAYYTEIYQNGSVVSFAENEAFTSQNQSALLISDVINCSQNDLITIYVANSNTSPSISNSALANFFSITKTGN